MQHLPCLHYQRRTQMPARFLPALLSTCRSNEQLAATAEQERALLPLQIWYISVRACAWQVPRVTCGVSHRAVVLIVHALQEVKSPGCQQACSSCLECQLCPDSRTPAGARGWACLVDARGGTVAAQPPRAQGYGEIHDVI